MEKLAIKPGGWVIVCDGRKALILENQGDEKFPNLRMRETYEHEDAKTSEQGTDRPGRVHESAGPGRSAVEQTDWQKQDEDGFLKEIGKHLDEATRTGKADALIIVAAPRALGVLRTTYTHGVKEALVAEIDKDMVNMPVYEIEKQLTQSS
ncbi:MAG: host attachment protein [Rhodomicrobiaceae bacterium]